MSVSRKCLFSILIVIFSLTANLPQSFGETHESKNSLGIRSSVIRGPLRVHASNPRYFTDGSGKAIFLTGSHTWTNFKDKGIGDPPAPFDFDAYLDFLEEFQHNFIRLWTWELPKYKCGRKTKIVIPFPWPRTGPGIASDGKPKFDLSRYDQLYFDRLRSRILKARDRGIYVSVMLFEGYGLQFCRSPQDGFPFAVGNNVNGINTDGICSHTLADRKVTAIQEAYVGKVIDTLNDLDNVLYEISNEDTGSAENANWQYHIIRFIKNYEATKPIQHPVGMTVQWPRGSNSAIFSSPADWVSPKTEGGYGDDPPASSGNKVVILDTDHLGSIGNQWVWKSFCRGHNPIFMDSHKVEEDKNYPGKSELELIRKNMGYTLTYSRRVNLVSMVPRNDLSSTTYCLSNPGKEYLIYLPSKGSHGLQERALVDLSESPETFRVEWFNPRTGETVDGGVVKGGGRKSLTAPFTGDAVLYIYKP